MMSDNNDLGAIASGTGALAVPVEPVPVSPLTGFDHLSQRARDIAADTVFRINSASTTHDPENTAAYCQYMREGAYDDDPVVQATLTALVHGEAAYGALSKAATRFDHCADMIAESFSASGTLRAERTIKARHYALEARAIAEGR